MRRWCGFERVFGLGQELLIALELLGGELLRAVHDMDALAQVVLEVFVRDRLGERIGEVRILVLADEAVERDPRRLDPDLALQARGVGEHREIVQVMVGKPVLHGLGGGEDARVPIEAEALADRSEKRLASKLLVQLRDLLPLVAPRLVAAATPPPLVGKLCRQRIDLVLIMDLDQSVRLVNGRDEVQAHPGGEPDQKRGDDDDPFAPPEDAQVFADLHLAVVSHSPLLLELVHQHHDRDNEPGHDGQIADRAQRQQRLLLVHRDRITGDEHRVRDIRYRPRGTH